MNDFVSKFIIVFLMWDFVEDIVFGWNLLNILNIFVLVDIFVVECMVVVSLFFNMVKCLYLFYDLFLFDESNG